MDIILLVEHIVENRNESQGVNLNPLSPFFLKSVVGLNSIPLFSLNAIICELREVKDVFKWRAVLERC